MKAQVSVETLLVVSILVSVFVLMLISIAYKNQDAAYYKDLFERQNTCNKMALAVSLSFAEGKKNFLLFDLDRNVSISKHSITVGNSFCDFIGDTNATAVSPMNLATGTIKIKNNSGVVEFDQNTMQ